MTGAGAATNRVLNEAASQRDRLRAAPHPEQVEVDGRSLAQVLAFAAQYGALIQFYDLDNQARGDWADFFGADKAVALALHAALDLPEIERSFLHVLAEAARAEDRPRRALHLRRAFAVIVKLIGVLDHAQASLGDAEAHLARLARAHRRDRLSEPLGRLHVHTAGRSLDEALARVTDKALEVWLEDLLLILEDVISTLLGELKRGLAAAQSNLEASLKADGHAPQAALYNAFAQLFMEARDALNHFPRRFVEFYYGDVLRQTSVAAQPDQVFLSFVKGSSPAAASVPEGVMFSAGTDAAGAAINYAADASLDVTAAQVETLSIHLVAPTSQAARSGAPTAPGVLSGLVDPAAVSPASPFPLFGSDQAGVHGALDLQPASLGFTVASPLLMLGGGRRTIEIGLEVSARSLASQAVAFGVGAQIGLEPEDVLAEVFQAAFRLSYSTAGGWVEVDGFTVEPGGRAGLLTLTIDLPPEAPPLVALTTKASPTAPPPTAPASAFPDPGGPAIVASWNLGKPTAGVDLSWIGSDPYGALAGLELTDVTLDISVEGLTGLTLMTPSGAVDSSQNFALLGLRPSQFATLEIQAPELFAKPVDSVSVEITWAGLPISDKGFQGYYQGYVLNADGAVAKPPLFDNTSFQVSFSVANPGFWDFGASTVRYLFQTGYSAVPQAAAPVSQVSTFTVATVKPARPPDAYYTAAASVLRMSLVTPAYAFGDALYASNLLKASLAQIPPPPKLGQERVIPPPLPNPPWTPMASAVTIGYRASGSVVPATWVGPTPTSLSPSGTPPASPGPSPQGATSFFHLRPFGRLAPAALGAKPVALLPAVDPHAALYIKLSAPVQRISLLFVLAASSSGWSSQTPQVQWEQHIDGSWVAITVLNDGTNSLANSGVIDLKLKTPAGATVTPRLRVRVLQGLEHVPLVVSVSTNAVSASWVGPGGADLLGDPLPPASIAKSVTPLANVAAIAQPMESFGGRPRAVGAPFHRWMSERLRHKGYGVDSWDYARLVLETVPSLWQAAVVPATDSETGQPAPGQVWVVVVGGPKTANVPDRTAPFVDLTVLTEIGERLEGVVSPWVDLSVTNPPYVRLQVVAELLFTDGDTSAAWKDKLNDELMRWLSPWPDASLGPRPAAYYTRHAVTEFVRGRPYVLGVMSLSIAPEDGLSIEAHGWCYLTTATAHRLKGRTRAPTSNPDDADLADIEDEDADDGFVALAGRDA